MNVKKRNSTSHQSLEDKFWAVTYFLSGQGLSFVVVKATTSEILGPKKKHLDYLVAMTYEPNVSIPKMVIYLLRRSMHWTWSVVFKSVIVIHHLLLYGCDTFAQNLASSAANLRTLDRIGSFTDKESPLGYSMSTFVRRYSRYIAAKVRIYQTLGHDFCRIGPANNEFRVNLKEFSHPRLMKILADLHVQFDSLVAFDAVTGDLSNGIINCAFAMLYKDFVKLYLTYQAAMVRLIELLFRSSSLKQAKELQSAYGRFLVLMNKVDDFMQVVDAVGIDRGDMPRMSSVPEQVTLRAIEERVKFLEDHAETKAGDRRSSSALLLNVNMSAASRISSTVEPLLPAPDYAALGGSGRRRRSSGSKGSRLDNSILKSPNKSSLTSAKSPRRQQTPAESQVVESKEDGCNTKQQKQEQQQPQSQPQPQPQPQRDLLRFESEESAGDLMVLI